MGEGTPLEAQGLGLRLPMQRVRFQSLVRKPEPKHITGGSQEF